MCTGLDLLINAVRNKGDCSMADTLQRERDSLKDPFEISDDIREDLEQAFSSDNAETAMSAVRKWFRGS